MLGRDDYVPAVGFAREPMADRRRWIGRVFILVIVGALVWLLFNRVFFPQDDLQPRVTTSQLPGPI